MTIELKDYDNNIQDEDEYETPDEVYYKLCEQYNLDPKLDACANINNTKCHTYLTDALHQEWNIEESDVWCNPPHSITEKFVRRAHNQWLEYNLNIIMIIPTNTMSSKFWHDCIEDIVEYHAIRRRIRFHQNGKPAPTHSRNAYVCVIWRKK